MVVGVGADGTDAMNQIQPNDFISKNNNMLAEMPLSQGFVTVGRSEIIRKDSEPK